MLEIFCRRWREAWLAGESLTIDETMIAWVGVTAGKL
jgi:aspartyl/asparaginyl beta-hydroxylase (cupin superfamily)